MRLHLIYFTSILYSALYPVNINRCIVSTGEIIILIVSVSLKKKNRKLVHSTFELGHIASICFKLAYAKYLSLFIKAKTSYIFFCCSGLGSFLFLSVAVQTLSTACREGLIAVAATSVCCQLSVPLPSLCKLFLLLFLNIAEKLTVWVDTVINWIYRDGSGSGVVHKQNIFQGETAWARGEQSSLMTDSWRPWPK